MNVLITGGTGSLGRALVRHFLAADAQRVVVFSRDEWKQAEMAGEIADPRIRFFLGDVRDRERLGRAFHGVTEVIHAAALKRVDAVSYNPSEVVKTNVLGTMNVVDAAIDAGVRRVVVVSSDKGVQPTNIYGASKFMAEQYAVEANSYGRPRGTAVAVVRYGNVLGSRGSVVHVFKRMAENGGRIKITDPRCTRFLITMPDAVGLIEKALRLMKGGEVFVPVLSAARITDLARAIAPEIEQVVTGFRDGGEKLHEALLTEEESTRVESRLGLFVVEKGNPARAPFSYTSDNPPRFYTVDEIGAMLKEQHLL